ncbi:MAG TPA: alpha/beta fold hydrolase [Mycobacteriales bacterium]|nr:alpha/beta fold hydrolase [Mycobacteriales bacterium]
MDRQQLATLALRKTLPVLPIPEDLPTGRVIDLPGRGSTYVVDTGRREGGPTLLLLHALVTTGMLTWYPAIARLAETHRVVVLDQRWHGRGIRSERFAFEDCADDAAAVLDVLGIDRAIPVGYSMGGSVAQLVWHRHHDRVEGLVLGATARNFRGRPHERYGLPAISAATRAFAPHLADRVERHAQSRPEVLPTSAHPAWGVHELRSTSLWAVPAVIAAIGEFNSAPWIGQVDVPTAVVVMSKDKAIPARRQRTLAAAIPGATVHEVEGGHGSLVLRRSGFVDALEEACASVVQRSRRVRPARRAIRVNAR